MADAALADASPRASRGSVPIWLVLLAAGGVFAVTMGARQSMGLFLGVLNSTTGLGLASISLAFGVGQLWWGLTQPAVAVLLFLFAPKTEAVVLIFAAVIGVTYLSTVPPTAGLVAKFFGTAHMATLFGFVMLSHQIGGFLGAWLGGKAFEWTGSYDWMWYADIVLAAGAALIHLPISEAVVPPRVAAATARRLTPRAASCS